MASLVKPFKSISAWSGEVLYKLRYLLIGLIAIALGLLFGYLYNSSQETAELTISILTIVALFLIIADKPLHGLLVLFILMPFVEQYVEIPMGAGIPDLSFSRFIVAFVFIFMLARAAIGKFHFATPISLTEIMIVATVIGIASAAPLDSNPNKIFQLTFTRRLLPLSMYFFARNLVTNKQDLHKLLWAVMLFGLFASLYAIYEHSTGHILFLDKETEAEDLRTDYTGGLYLIRGLLNRAGNFARVLVTTIPVTFYLFFENKGLRRKLILATILVIQFYAMFITYNRTCWYALMVALFVLQFFYPQFRKLYLVMVFVAVVVLWATWDKVTESQVVEGRINYKTENFNGRDERWNAAIRMWQAKPIRGWGEEAYATQSGRFRRDGFTKNFGGMENDYLFILVSSGLIGFTPFFLFLVIPLIDSIRLFFKARAPDWSGFIKPETVAVYWGVMISYAMAAYTQTQSTAIVMILPFALGGAIVGTHHAWLKGLKTSKKPVSPLSPVTPVVAKTS